MHGPGRRIAAAAFLVTALFAGCAGVGVRRLPPAQHGEIVLIATSDFRASLERAEALAGVVRELRGRYGDQLLYVDSGNLFQGSIEANLSRGSAVTDFYDLLGVDAVAIGNHDFSYGLKALQDETHRANFPWLSANVLAKSSGPVSLGRVNALGARTAFRPRAVVYRDGHKICIVGVTSPETPRITRPEFVDGLSFAPLKPVVEAEARLLRTQEGCEYVILAAHAGLECDTTGRGCQREGDHAEVLRLLRELRPGTVDAVVAGHTHQLAQEVINGTPVLQVGGEGAHVGVLRLWKRAGATQSHFEPFIDVPADAGGQDDVTAALQPYRDSAREISTRMVGYTSGIFTHRYDAESALGDLIADAVLAAGREMGKADFSLVNSGGIRANLPAGRVSYGDVFRVFPFDNSIAVVELTGAELKRLIEIAESGGHGISPVSGLVVHRLDVASGRRGPWDRDLNHDGRKEDWERNLIVALSDSSGRVIRDDVRYRLATYDFLAEGGDHQNFVYSRVPHDRIHVFPSRSARDAVAAYLLQSQELSPTAFPGPAGNRVVAEPVATH